MQLREKLAGAGVGLAIVIAAIAACRSTDDPLEGTPQGNTSTSSSSTSGNASSGGADAAGLPSGDIECGAAPTGGAFSKQALLGAAADCAAWHSCQLVNAASALRKAVHENGDRQAAWKVAMDSASRLEGFRFGPWASKGVDPYHGRGLRSFVHAWPDINRCEVEKQVALRDYEKGWNLTFPSGRGLFGLEVLFFYEGADTACLPNSATGQKWAASSPAELTAGKEAYAKALADNILAVAVEARNVYLPVAEGGEGFKEKLLAAQGYGSEQEALNVVGWSLFYPEGEIKDDKLAALAGITGATAANRETPFAKVDIENIRTNLRAFRSLFQGCGEGGAGLGFDDWLTEAGHQQLANDMLTALAKAEAAAAAFPPFDQASQAQFKTFYDEVKPLSDLIKGSMFGSGSPLNLKLPASAASDTD
ncbi:MAG: hypothetical protein KIT84_08945 [Labilithrix sp.]|nr:hypothetical protein [Labilithrix sp.]MCW5811126.1 hypothetical protein [Labilithrix sp.]